MKVVRAPGLKAKSGIRGNKTGNRMSIEMPFTNVATVVPLGLEDVGESGVLVDGAIPTIVTPKVDGTGQTRWLPERAAHRVWGRAENAYLIRQAIDVRCLNVRLPIERKGHGP